MSGSLASAKAKRAGIAPTIPVPQSVPAVQGQQLQTKLTFQQVIHVIDNRLARLEQEMKAKVASAPGPTPAKAPAQVQTQDQESKFMMLAEEITTMKDVLMKLQAFTMDVNKTLFNERIQIMSDIKADDIEEDEISMVAEMGI